MTKKIEKEQQHKPQFTKWRKNKGQFKRKEQNATINKRNRHYGFDNKISSVQ